MIKREFKINLKSFLIWTGILIFMFLVVYLIYPYLITDDSMNQINEMMKIFPQEMLKAFNIDIAAIDTAYGWFMTEGFTFVLIIVGIYSSILGSNIVLKEESDKTIEYLSFLPIKRSKIMFNKIIVAITYIILMILVLGIFNYISLTISGDFDQKQFILLSLTPLFVGLPLFALNLFIATFMHKTRKTVAMSLGIVFLFYIINIISQISDKVEFIKYFSVYTLADTRNVMTNSSINLVNVVISLGITMVLIALSFARYNKKELV